MHAHMHAHMRWYTQSYTDSSPRRRLYRRCSAHHHTRALKWRTTSGGTHTASISALARTHPALAPSIRLAKRWLACQLYTGEVPPSLVELLTAATFASAGERAPCSAVCGFANFLHLLASYDFEHEPLLFGLPAALLGGAATFSRMEFFRDQLTAVVAKIFQSRILQYTNIFSGMLDYRSGEKPLLLVCIGARLQESY